MIDISNITSVNEGGSAQELPAPPQNPRIALISQTREALLWQDGINFIEAQYT